MYIRQILQENVLNGWIDILYIVKIQGMRPLNILIFNIAFRVLFKYQGNNRFFIYGYMSLCLNGLQGVGKLSLYINI